MVTSPEIRKGNNFGKYEMLRKTGVPEYTDMAYREAVSRLRYLLNETYVSPPPKYSQRSMKPEESDEESGVSIVVTDRTKTARLSPYRKSYSQLIRSRPQQNVQSSQPQTEAATESVNASQSSPELMSFIERQEEYIDQLEKEAQYCRDELSQLLGKVKELIAENESLQEQQKNNLMKTMLEGPSEERLSDYQASDKYRKRLEGPSIVFESRISELEAQLTQSKIDLRKAQEEAELYKRKLEDSQPSSSNYDFYKQIENLQREKRDLNESLAKLQASINQIREKEIDASKKVQRTLDVVDKTQFEKQQAEMEVYRLKSELELQHDKLLEVLSEQTRKVADERGQAERRYLQHVERLNAELTAQRDAFSKMQMEVEKHLRIEEDLKRDLTAKNLTIENVKKELNNKIASLQNELAAALSERDSLEQELNTSRMSGERTERLNKQESSRLQVEVSALRQRLDRGDAELIHCRRENLRLLEQISTLEKELTLYKIKLGEKKDPIEEEEEQIKEKLLNSRISDIESKHVETVSELEGLIENQSQVMAQLKAECQSLTQKLEESTARHKTEMENLQSKLNAINNKMESNFGPGQWNSGDTIAKHEPATLEESQNHLIMEERKDDRVGNNDNYNQRYMDDNLHRAPTGSYEEPFDQTYNNSQSYQSMRSNNVENDYGSSTKYEDNFGNNSLKQESNNGAYDSETKYGSYEGDQQPSNYQQHSYQEQQPSYQEQQHSYQDPPPSAIEQPSYQEHTSFQEQVPVYQEQDAFQEHSSYSEQPVFQEQTSYKDPNTAQEPYQTFAEVPSEPVSVPPTDSPEVLPVETKPASETPKSTTTQRFQRAAELSRQASKSEESARGKSATQARTRNSQFGRAQQKAPQSSRFK